MAWLDDDPALLVSYRLTPKKKGKKKGLGMVDERRAETAVWVARYQEEIRRENLAILPVLVPQTAADTWRVLWALVCLIFSLCTCYLVSLSFLSECFSHKFSTFVSRIYSLFHIVLSFSRNIGMLTNLIFLLQENFTNNSDRTLLYILGVPKFEHNWRHVSIYSVYKQWCLCFTFFFFLAYSFSSVGHLAWGEVTTYYFLYFLLSFSFFSFDLSSLFLFFVFDCFVSFLYFIECVCRACRIKYDEMALHCPPLYLLHTWQCSVSVAQLRDHRTCTSSRIEESAARALVVLDVAEGQKERLNVKNTQHTLHGE